MRIFINDTFYDRLFKLSSAAQRKVLSFMQKFRENPKSPAIHLESINQMKDDTLWSARIDDTYRAIVGVLGGDVYSLVYVDHHDEAYRWASKKKFIWNEHTQACQLVPLVIDEDIPEVKQPVSTDQTEPRVMDGITPEQLLKIGVPENLTAIVLKLNDLNDLDQLENVLPPDAYENLFALFDGNDINSIINSIEEGKAADGDDKLLSANNKGRFIELTDDEYLADIINKGMDKWQLFLHPSQRKIVESEFKGSYKVSGSAGTGKTVAALHRMKYLCKNPNANVLYTTYTTALRDNLVTLAKKLDIPTNRYTVNNIDPIMLEMAEKCRLTEGVNVMDIYGGNQRSLDLWKEVTLANVCEFRPEFLYDEYIDVIIYNNIQNREDYLRQSRIGRSKAINRKQRMEIWSLKEAYEKLKHEHNVIDRLELFNRTANYMNEHDIHPFTNVIVDEFQDFSNPELRFIRSLVTKGHNDLFLVGDPFQRIYRGRRLNFSSAGIDIRGRSRRLKVNYRTTEEIKNVAVAVVKGVSFDDLDGGEETQKGYVSLIHGDMPVYRIVDSPAEEIETIISYINECTGKNVSPEQKKETDNYVKPEEICIAASSLGLTRDLQSVLHRNGMDPYVWKNRGFSGNKAGVRICTLYSIKGLEFRVVIVMGVNERNIPSVVSTEHPFPTLDKVEKQEYLMQFRSLIYVAITRARQSVLITGYGDKCGLLKDL